MSNVFSNDEMSNVQNFSSIKIMLTLLINNYANDDKSDSDEKLFTPCPFFTDGFGFCEILQ